MIFPIITHYQELKDLIKDRPEFVFNFEEETNTFVVKYNHLLGSSFDHENEDSKKLLHEARGITFDASSGKVVARKFHKFYNIGEKSSSSISNIDFSKPHWRMVKEDGSMISFLKIDGQYFPVTKAGRSEVATMVDAYGNMENYKSLLDFCYENDYTALFEFCSLKQRIVLEYNEEKLILLAIRDNVTGKYVYNPDQLKEIGIKYNIPVVESTRMDNIDISQVISEIKDAEGIEGIIIRFEDGSMYKVKSDEYIRFHNAVSRIKQEKDIVKIILNDELDDIIPMLNEKDAIEIREFADSFINGLQNTVKNIVNYGLKHYKEDQKGFALSVLSEDVGKLYGKFLLRERSLLDGNHVEIYDMVYKKVSDYIYKECMSGPRLNSVRELFGGVQFHKIYMEE